MIKQLNLEQLSLHHGKIAQLDNFDPFKHIVYRLIEDLTDKINELVVEQNMSNNRITFAGPIESWIEPGNAILILNPGNPMDASDIAAYDVVWLPDLFPFLDNHIVTIANAFSYAIKRVVFGFYDAPSQEVTRLERWMNAMNYQWTHDEAAKRTYIIEKTEGKVERPLLDIG